MLERRNDGYIRQGSNNSPNDELYSAAVYCQPSGRLYALLVRAGDYEQAVATAKSVALEVCEGEGFTTERIFVVATKMAPEAIGWMKECYDLKDNLDLWRQ